MKKYLINWFLLFILGLINLQAQINQKSYTEIYDSIYNNIMNGRFILSQNMIDSLYHVALSENQTFIEFEARRLQHSLHLQKNEIESAKSILLKNIDRASQLSNKPLKDSLLLINNHALGNLYGDKGDNELSIVHHLKSLKLAEKFKDSTRISISYTALGYQFFMQGHQEDALEYYEKALTYSFSEKAKAQVYNNIAIVYYYDKKFEQAEHYFLKSFKYSNTKNIEDMIGSYNNLAAVSSLMGDSEKAINYFNKAHQLSLKSKSNYKIATSLMNLSVFHADIGQFEKTKKYMKMCDSISKSISSLEHQNTVNFHFYYNYKKMKNYKNALAYYEKHIKLKDSLFNEKSNSTAQNLKIEYETQIKETKIKTQQQLITSQKKQNTWLIVGLFILAFLISGLYVLYKQRMKAQKALFKNQEELATEKVNMLLETQKVKSIQSHLEGQNKERTRIAKDLHDSISGNLAAIKMKLSNVKENHSQEIDSIISSIDETYNEVRTISHNLLPKKVLQQDFVSVLKQLVLLYKSENINLTIEIFPEEIVNQISKKIQIEIYRVLQELITNIIKHAQASKGQINITLHENYLNLLIEDNGLGFSPKKEEKGIGLNNIFSRIKSLNGSIDVDSEPIKGTTVNINIPIE